MLNDITRSRKLLLGGGAVAAILGIALIAVAAVTMLGSDDKTEAPIVRLTLTPSPTPKKPLVTAAPTPSQCGAP